MKSLLLSGSQSLGFVSTLAVEWIEIDIYSEDDFEKGVSTLAVEWIEICSVQSRGLTRGSLHPRGGVD